LPAAAANAFVRNGGKRDILYCPGFAKQNNNELWSFTTGVQGEEAGEKATGYRVIGYAVAFKGAGRVRSTNITESMNPLPWKMKDGTEYNPSAAQRVIVADGTLSNGENEKDRTKNQYTKIDGGWKGHQAPHLAGKLPEGGNLLFLDGHTEFRNFQNMLVRTDGNPPAFWW
jgi:prepilin-type processing-associated H-X9-DG protein